MACLINCFRNTETNPSIGSRERFGLREYSYGKLADSTDKFSNANLLGEGGFGQVYKGSIDGKVVAIKKLKQLPDEQSREGLEQEIKVVSSVSHKNLVKLVGYCIEGPNRLLVLEYVPQRSLKFHLHGNNILEWKNRMKIAIGSAKGLEYLHELCKPKIIHRDIKADNILVDDNFEPKVADFGLALFFPEIGSLTHISRSNKGTEVYADPENYPSQKVSEKSDVYSYGVVLLELITGRKTKVEGIDIVTWAKSRIEYALRSGDFTNLLDPKLQMNCVEEELRIMICCSTACVYKPSHFRPLMKEIVRALEGYMSIKDIWDEKNDNKFLSDNPKPNGSHNVDEFQHTVPKPLVLSEAINGIESRNFTQQELMVTTNGSSNTTKVNKKFRAYFEDDYKLNSFTYQELIVATRGFSEDNRLDEGPLGQVYKGDLNGEKVTVKKFNNPRKQEEEYKKMKAIGSSFHHRNVVNLIGYCEEGANRLLVYEFIPQGKSFRCYLSDGGSTLPWITRIRICIRAADIQALLLTSDECWWDPSLHWKDIFLLGDDDLEPKLAEYGREKFFSDFSPHKSNSCMAPEYTSTRMFTQKTRVYSCGVMLLEMITGKEAVDAVLQWAVPQLERARSSGNYDFVDRRLKDYNKIEMDRMIACSLACLRDNPQDRPEMSQVEIF
ncbi:hypothetical protein MANES_07G052900v8 [Manihot esculenta]|uniref:Uncharacterized protein n=1 Tax=Manihot esculenta TaxID=3983 RepID=A0ACB7HEJ4_MANES|nr:hypothetical protein MANES_07G052900v8 [Manihot esculenta]